MKPGAQIIPLEEASAILLHLVIWKPDARPDRNQCLPDEQLTRVTWDEANKAQRLIDRIMYLALHVDLLCKLKEECAPSSSVLDVERFLRSLKVSASLYGDRIRMEESKVSFDVFADGRILRSPTAHVLARRKAKKHSGGGSDDEEV